MRNVSIFLVVIMTAAAAGAKSPIKSDEDVVFFPTCAYLAGGQWVVPIHGWIFEPEQGSTWRALFTDGLAGAVGDEVTAEERATFNRRLRWFLVDNERGKKIPVRIGDERVVMAASEPNGHFMSARPMPGLPVPKKSDAPARFVTFEAETRPGDERQFSGRVQLVPPEGVTVVSDIDDTIKVTGVLDRRTMILNTFYRPFQAVPGMADAYRALAARGAVFFYLSASPWQLYPPLAGFMDQAGFPRGAVRLRHFRVKDRSLVRFLRSSKGYKRDTILGLLARFPERRFILVGDSGERDPEVYGAIAREHPGRILHVFIRRVEASDLSDQRLAKAFDKIPAGHWTLFEDPAVLATLRF